MTSTKGSSNSRSIKLHSLNTVTRHNFDRLLPRILRLLEDASFVAVDTELSGLCTHRSQRYSIFDDLQQRYSKLVESASSFALLQFGLAVYRFEPDRGHCTATAFSFHLFPAAIPNLPERRFSMQHSSIAFLAENRFDFNASLIDGIPFLSRFDERQQRAKIDPGSAEQAVNESSHPSTVELCKPEDRDFVGNVMSRVDAWVAAGALGKLDLAPCNGYQRLLTYQQIELKYHDRLLVCKIQSPSGPFLQVSAPSPEERTVLEAADMEERLGRLRSDVGFRQVIDRIVELKLPLVGHNCFLDLCHMYDKFVGRLPNTLLDFKSELTKMFPVIVDTKFIAGKDPELSGLGLSELYGYFADSRQNLLHAPGLHRLEAQFHDAGYDAYCTGLVLIGLLHKRSSGTSLNPFGGDAESSSSSMMIPINLLFVMQSPYVDGLNIAGPDSEPDRAHIFLLSGLPERWRASQVTEALCRALNVSDFTVHMSLTPQSGDAYVSFQSDASFRNNEHVQLAVQTGKLRLTDGTVCGWQSFDRRIVPEKRDQSLSSSNH